MMYFSVLKAAAFIVAASPLFWILRRTIALYRNYQQVKDLGVPIIVCPVNWQDLYWSMFRGWFQWMRNQPWGRWVKFSTVGWPSQFTYRPHHEYGSVFIVVSPSGIEIWTDDPGVAAEAMNKPKTWVKPKKFYIPFEIFGHNVLSSNGPDWQRQRKIVNSAFVENTYAPVWSATAKQAQKMLHDTFESQRSVDLSVVKSSTDMLTMGVLAAGVFGHDEAESDQIKGNHRMSFADSQRWFIHNFIPLILFGSLKVPKSLRSLIPSKLKILLDNKEEYEQYLNESINQLREEDEKVRSSADLLTMMIRSNNESDKGEVAPGNRKIFLTEAEMRSNLFVLNMAGFETTSSSLSFTIPYLALFPDVQDWALEEVRKIIQKQDQSAYDDCFPEMVRLKALMYETLRLRGALQVMVKLTLTDEMLQFKDKQLIVPGNSLLCINFASIHQDPNHWGSDSEQWRPQRWVETDPATGKERLKEAPSSTIFSAWTAGPRACPGKKFSQVEFTAAMLTILSECRIELARLDGESEEQARDRVLKVVHDIDGIITPKFRRPLDAEVVFVKRD